MNTAVIWLWSCLYSYNSSYIPFTQVSSQQLAAQSLEFQCATADFVGGLEINLPSDKLLQNIPFLKIRLAEKVHPVPITGARTMFLDGSRKTGRAAITWQKLEKFCILRTFLYSKCWAFHCNHGPAVIASGIFVYNLWLRVYCLYYSASKSGIN